MYTLLPKIGPEEKFPTRGLPQLSSVKAVNKPRFTRWCRNKEQWEPFRKPLRVIHLLYHLLYLSSHLLYLSSKRKAGRAENKGLSKAKERGQVAIKAKSPLVDHYSELPHSVMMKGSLFFLHRNCKLYFRTQLSYPPLLGVGPLSSARPVPVSSSESIVRGRKELYCYSHLLQESTYIPLKSEVFEWRGKIYTFLELDEIRLLTSMTLLQHGEPPYTSTLTPLAFAYPN